MKGFFSIELLFIFYLLPYLFHVSDTGPIPVLRETEVYAQDAAQMLMYGHSLSDLPLDGFAVWVDGLPNVKCDYEFKYCTSRYYEGGEHRICAAECLP